MPDLEYYREYHAEHREERNEAQKRRRERSKKFLEELSEKHSCSMCFTNKNLYFYKENYDKSDVYIRANRGSGINLLKTTLKEEGAKPYCQNCARKRKMGRIVRQNVNKLKKVIKDGKCNNCGKRGNLLFCDSNKKILSYIPYSISDRKTDLFIKTKNLYCINCRNISQKETKSIITEIKKEAHCKNCGISNPVLLDFHHRESEKKLFTIGNIHQYSIKTEKVLREEIAKCDILCANCHRLEHHKLKTKSS